jgi:hypothetical protein
MSLGLPLVSGLCWVKMTFRPSSLGPTLHGRTWFSYLGETAGCVYMERFQMEVFHVERNAWVSRGTSE